MGKNTKEAWDTDKRKAFERKLVNWGWRFGIYTHVQHAQEDGALLEKGTISILTDSHGIFIYDHGVRTFGLCDDLVDTMLKHYLGPLQLNPFAKNKKYVWLDLQTCQILKVRP